MKAAFEIGASAITSRPLIWGWREVRIADLLAEFRQASTALCG
jgi:hypothetical protein